MTTWRDVERVHRAHPKWNASEIAAELGCGSAYVRATANRRKWDIPRKRRRAIYSRVRVATADVLPICLPQESPHVALKRIVAEALKARAA